MADVKRKKGESFEALYRRFSKRIQQSGRMLQARKIRFHADAPNKAKQKGSALRRIQVGKKRAYLIRIGQLVEDRRRGRRRR